MTRARTNYAPLLEDVDVKRWYDNVARGSPVTADVYLRRVGAFCRHFKIEPKDLTFLTERELYNKALDYISFMEKSGKAGGYINCGLKAVKSWLAYNGKEIRRKIKIRGSEETPSLKEERVPIKTELRRILLAGDEKARSICALMAFSGLRPQTIGNYRGNDGLTISDFPEISITNQLVTFLKVPTMIIVRRELSKAKHQYFTFLSQEGCNYLKDYLEARIRESERLFPDSAIITPKQKMKPFIRSSNVGDAVRACIRKAGYSFRPYTLRCYFDTQLMLAESKGLILRDYRKFFMGHKGDIENRYTTNKQRLPETVTEDMRGAYARSEEFLQTRMKVETSEEKLQASFRRQLLLVSGFSKDEVTNIELSSLNDDEIQSMLRKKLLGVSDSENGRQKVVGVNEVNDYLAKGWEYVAKLSNTQVVIKISTMSS
jgi:integrase